MVAHDFAIFRCRARATIETLITAPFAFSLADVLLFWHHFIMISRTNRAIQAFNTHSIRRNLNGSFFFEVYWACVRSHFKELLALQALVLVRAKTFIARGMAIPASTKFRTAGHRAGYVGMPWAFWNALAVI
jgi:hypothetical protein